MPEETVWTSVEAEQAIAFFNTEAGQRYREVLRTLRPPFPGDVKKLSYIRRASLIEGYELCLSMLDHVLSPDFNKTVEPTEAYQDLDDDSKWEDNEE